MNILALIPARGGSKRLPGKNIKTLGGMPLIAWSIKTAIESECCVDVLVSTDDPAIADISKSYGAAVPWLRPSELASDTATSVDVAIHALDAYEAEQGPVDGLLLLQPTSPFRSVLSIRQALAIFRESGGLRPVVSITHAQSHPAWCFRLTEDRMTPFLGWEALDGRSQDLEPAWALNGSIYVISPSQLRDQRTFLTRNVRPYAMHDFAEAIDVDTPADFALCEALLSASQGKHS